MNGRDEHSDDYRSLLILDEISKNNDLTQRDMSKKIGVALGLVNSYLKNLVSKGYITVAAIPRKRYAYYLTPNGFAEKTRLTYQHLQNFTSLYRVARRDFNTLFSSVRNCDIKKVAFCGLDEVTEIAYLSLKETDMELTGVVDDRGAGNGKKFFGMTVLPMEDIKNLNYDAVIITSFQGGAALKQTLLGFGVSDKKIRGIHIEGWITRIEGSENKAIGGAKITALKS
ncbi:MAG: winged helix-turn-helix transcriptional regulator [Deltaproteobacteria bacterium]|nr:winged helix-turn-helix transcriptional regulator [Deltaproteobacteria bacterium]